MHLGCGALFGVWDASPDSAAGYAVTARGAAQPAGKPLTTMTTDPDGKPYRHNAEQAEAAKAALQAWDELTNTTHPRAFGRMKDAMEKLRDAVEDHEADEVGRVVDAMTPEQVAAYLASMGVNLEELRAHTEEMRTKIETKLGKPDALAQARCGLADAKLTIGWQEVQLAELRRVIALVAKHADFSQCPPEVEEEVDRVCRGDGGPAS